MNRKSLHVRARRSKNVRQKKQAKEKSYSCPIVKGGKKEETLLSCMKYCLAVTAINARKKIQNAKEEEKSWRIVKDRS